MTLGPKSLILVSLANHLVSISGLVLNNAVLPIRSELVGARPCLLGSVRLFSGLLRGNVFACGSLDSFKVDGFQLNTEFGFATCPGFATHKGQPNAIGLTGSVGGGLKFGISGNCISHPAQVALYQRYISQIVSGKSSNMRLKEISRLASPPTRLDDGVCIRVVSYPKSEPLHERVLGSVRGWYHTSLLRLVLRQSRSTAHHIWSSRYRPTVVNYAEVRRSLPQLPCSDSRNEMQFSGIGPSC
jgi:hypothetical protein